MSKLLFGWAVNPPPVKNAGGHAAEEGLTRQL
jgi:hypothetical protein